MHFPFEENKKELSDALERGQDKLRKYYAKTDNVIASGATLIDPAIKTSFRDDDSFSKGDRERCLKQAKTLYQKYYAPCQDSMSGFQVPKRRKLLDRIMQKPQRATHSEMDDYLDLPVDQGNAEGDANAIQWWGRHCKYYPHLAVMAADLLAFPPGSVDDERLFSFLRLTIPHLRSQLDPETVSSIAQISSWIRQFGMDWASEAIESHFETSLADNE